MLSSFFIAEDVPTDVSPDRCKFYLHDELINLILKNERSEIGMATSEFNALVARLHESEFCLGRCYGFPGQSTDNGDRIF